MDPTYNKGKSPFYPGQPVPIELFVGRIDQIRHIMARGVGQVAAGKPIAMYVQGDYGIGKSSVARLVLNLAESSHGLLAIYAQLGGAKSMDDVGEAVLRATVQSGIWNPTRAEKLRNWLARYVGEQNLFGVFTLHAEALRKDAPALARDMLPFLADAVNRLKDTGIKGVFLVLDEINGIADNPAFAHFVKGLVDQNAMSREPVPLLLMLCGVEERRREMIANHPPVDRIFDIVQIDLMSTPEMEDFFHRTFASVQMDISPEAMGTLTYYSAGLPKIMHEIGDAAFWADTDGTIDRKDALRAVVDAADAVGKKYVDQQVYRALRSEDYRSILDKVGKAGTTFTRAEISKGLSGPEGKKLDNFLRRMRELQVIRPGDATGEYVFNVRMVHTYIFLQGTTRDRATGWTVPSD